MRKNSLLALTIVLLLSASLAAADPAKKPAPSLDDELFQGLDDATKAPGVKPTPSATGDKPSSPPATKPAETKPSESAKKPVAQPGPQKSTPSSNPLDDELLKSLGGDDPAPAKKPEQNRSGGGAKPSDGPPSGDAPTTQPSADPFERLTQQIRDAEKRLRQVDTGDKTQEMQRKIVEDLDKLISQIEQQQQQQQQQNQSQSQSKPQSQPQPQPKPGQPQSQQNSSEQDSDKAKDSQAGTRSSKNQKPEPGRLQSLLEKAWGSLPERQRQDVMQSSVDDFPAKYQAVIEEYFKTLLRREE